MAPSSGRTIRQEVRQHPDGPKLAAGETLVRRYAPTPGWGTTEAGSYRILVPPPKGRCGSQQRSSTCLHRSQAEIADHQSSTAAGLRTPVSSGSSYERIVGRIGAAKDLLDVEADTAALVLASVPPDELPDERPMGRFVRR